MVARRASKTSTRSTGGLVAMAVLLVAVLASVPQASARPGGGGGGGAPAPTATQIVVDSVTDPGVSLPNTPGAPTSYIEQGEPFDVKVSFKGGDPAGLLPLSASKDVTIVLTVLSGPDKDETWLEEVPAGDTDATFTDVVLDGDPEVLNDGAANDVTLQVAVLSRKPTAVEPGVSAAFDVLEVSDLYPVAPARASIGGATTDEGCEATPDAQVCADLLLPDPNGVKSPLFLALGTCTGLDDCAGSFVQAIVALDGAVYDKDSPATMVMKCDKTRCRGGAIQNVRLVFDIDLDDTDDGDAVPDCPAKGVIGPDPMELCVDYVQSTRDNAGDTILYLLFDEDLRVRFQ